MTSIGVAALWGRGGATEFFPKIDLQHWAIAIASGLGVGLVMVAASRLAAANLQWAAQLAEEFRSLIGPLSGRQALAVAAASAVAEELLFRGILQPPLGLWLTAAIFGVLHIGPNIRFLPWTVMACGAGLAFGWLFHWTSSLAAPILAHATVNYLNLRYLTQTTDGDELCIDPVGDEHPVGQ
ncbi:MAG: hypothetical protein A2289_06115 [Deltaproteobacteria bacterium RIFOXYA12_FULL_58_15]|nr:MAG: hypothetical protein A2289_06115 [Deltaproteobacteria bacterium RIFOXYA12_FULL_58_15]OGR09228.1 MAG: hypothetical protein A2341_23670 [Deltaproteobacteria bacterium RIFOXYB12_FULL_58_9]